MGYIETQSRPLLCCISMAQTSSITIIYKCHYAMAFIILNVVNNVPMHAHLDHL